MEDVIHCPSPNSGVRRGNPKVSMLVLHYTDMNTAEEALDRMCDPEAQVSAHYMIARKGHVFQLVDESQRAWHAGVSYWDEITDVNSHSIGVELVNPGHSNGYEPFPEIQMNNLAALCKELVERYKIPARNILGHSDIAPGRKIDPGYLFDWKWLAEQGVGIWPEPAQEVTKDAEELLFRLGYTVENLKDAISAFQLRYRPSNYDGVADDETLALMEGLLAAYRAQPKAA